MKSLETSTDAEQRNFIRKEQETLAKYVSIILWANQIWYRKIQEKEYATDIWWYPRKSILINNIEQ